MTERIDFNALAAQCAQEEARLQFASFSRQDALALGLLVRRAPRSMTPASRLRSRSTA